MVFVKSKFAAGLSGILFLTALSSTGEGIAQAAAPVVWVEETASLSIEPAGLTAIEVKTDNGTIDFDGQASGAPAEAGVRKKAGAATESKAREALAAIEIISARSANGEHKLGWRWNVPQQPGWQAQVSFDIKAPGNVRFDADTENGEVIAKGLSGDVKIDTDNGRVQVEARSGALDVETDNGVIQATYAGPRVTLRAHNGKIEADLRGCAAVRGKISTHNGTIKVLAGSQTSADIVAKTDLGRVTHEGPLTVVKSGVTSLEGRLGAGGQRLELETHNGSISIQSGGE